MLFLNVREYFDRNSCRIVLAVTIIFGLISFYYYFSTKQNLLYGDARSHLNISRRVVDNTHPGFAQLGGVWLPLLHILMLPFISNNYFWHSGLAGSIVNFFSFVVAVFYLFKIARLLFPKNLTASYLIPLLYILNPNILYMSTTAMTEVLFIATFTASVYYLLRWIRYEKLENLIVSSFFILATSLNRYEGWAVALASVFTVLLVQIFKKDGLKKIEGTTILYSGLALVGMMGWLIWNIIIFHQPFYFLNSIYSSKLQTLAGFAVKGTKSVILYHNLPNSISAYGLAVAHNGGIIMAACAIISLFVILISTLYAILLRKLFSKDNLILGLLISPFLFECYAIYKGNVPINVPELTGGIFNIRLGLYAVPSAIIIIVLGIKRIAFKSTLFIFLILLFQTLLFYPTFTSPIALESGKEGISDKVQAANWIKNHYTGGRILASSAVSDPLLFDSGLNLKEFVTDGSQALFQSSLIFPAKHVEFIVISNQPVDKKRDLVYITFSKHKSRLDQYRVIYKNSAFTIYQKSH